MADEVQAYGAMDAAVTERLFETVKQREAELLWDYRLRLCDLLHGRVIRAQALKELANALELEALGAPVEAWGQALDRAAHWEWMATITERGQVLWGRRNNRLGRPEEE